MCLVKENDRVRVVRFNGSLEPDEDTHPSDNFWLLIEKLGKVVQDPSEDSLFASFSAEDRVCVVFDEDVSKLGLVCHNRVPNSLWLAVADLEVLS